ncbi:hypothetical protein ACFOYW_00195 [Gryllotalpicola reticulitermitis]|uniref:HPP family protein n=1 Tax=Gryllotalpicola reticulitermitis TaxID=1184153 RepID=A0ABV8Q2Q8_9MICO
MSRLAASVGRGALMGAAVLCIALAATAGGQEVVIVPLSLSVLVMLIAPNGPLAAAPTVARGYLLALAAGSAVALIHLPTEIAAAIAAAIATAVISAGGPVHPPAVALAIEIGWLPGATPESLLGSAIAVVAGLILLLAFQHLVLRRVPKHSDSREWFSHLGAQLRRLGTRNTDREP